MNQSDRPTADVRGITSSRAIDDAEAAGTAIEVGSNFLLFFSSQMSSTTMASHQMHANAVRKYVAVSSYRHGSAHWQSIQLAQIGWQPAGS